MNAKLARLYKKARKEKPFSITGEDAKASLHFARTLLQWNELERDEKVRLVMTPEEESYFSVYGEPCCEEERERISDAIDRLGIYWVASEVYKGCAACGRGAWEHADSIGMCVYNDPLSPWENPYVIALMESAIELVEEDAS